MQDNIHNQTLKTYLSNANGLLAQLCVAFVNKRNEIVFLVGNFFFGVFTIRLSGKIDTLAHDTFLSLFSLLRTCLADQWYFYLC